MGLEMEFEALTIIRAPLQLAKKASMFCHRRNLHYAEAFCFMVVLSATLFTLGMNEPCSMAVLRNQLECDACRSYRDESGKHFQNVFPGDVNARPASQDLLPHTSLSNVCPESTLFCFRSTLLGFLSPDPEAKSTPSEVSGVHSDAAFSTRTNQARTNVSLSSCCGVFMFSSGRNLSCSLYDQESCHKLPHYHIESEKGIEVSSCTKALLDHKIQHFPLKDDGGIRKSGILDDSSTHVEISPPLLDWGHKNLYSPSLAFLTVRNTHCDNILTVFEPYSANSQYYPCNFSEILLAPGEDASICFVFLPTLLGLSSAQLVLQTSFGGFLIQATGFGLESPYGIPPLIGPDASSSGKWRKNLSLFNPFSEALYVEEVTAWISISSGNTSPLAKALCSISSIKDRGEFSFPSVMEWIDVKISEVDLPLISVRPHRNWEVGPQKTETIMELDFLFHSKAKIFGAFCMQLLKSSKEKFDTIMVPLEAELGGTSANDELVSPILVFLETLVPCDTSGTAVVLSLRNEAPYLLSVLKISEVGESSKHFHIKYLKGLMLFPSTVTQVALVSFTLASQMHNHTPGSVGMNINCGFVILTNDSRNSQVEISCRDVISVCSRGKLDSSIRYAWVSEEVEYGDTRTKSSGNAIQPLLLNEALNTAKEDELVLMSWNSHATSSGMSVLADHELLFPVVGIGSHSTQLITVRNPSQQPVVMQLILNSWEIIDECKATDELFQPSFSSSLIGNSSVSPSYGFSIVEGALTEAFVHPYGSASLGPIIFQPSNRCGWKSSALIRNNLSGVELLSLRGYGGSLSLVLFEESEPVHNLDFKLIFLTHTFSSPDLLYHVEDDIDTCSQPLSKELYAKNMGDLPLEVKRIEVSGTECGLDGFVVQACKGFTLEPGESIKLKITYQTDFFAATIQRDLELALATGILVIPMKASIPMYMLSFCKKSLFWMRVKKSVVAILLVASLFFLVLCCFLLCVMVFGSQDYSFKSAKSFTLRGDGKSYYAHQIQKTYNKFTLCAKMNRLLRSIGEEEALQSGSHVRYDDRQTVLQEQTSTVKHVEHEKLTNSLLDIEKETALSSSSMANSMAVKSHHIQETTQAGNLEVKTGKDKGRRRRKKRSSGSGVSGLFEVSSSQSGNSTPSSPLSPASSSTPQRSLRLSPDVDQSGQARNPFATVANRRCERKLYSESNPKADTPKPEIPLKPSDGKNSSCGISAQDKSAVLLKMDGKPIFPSATFACPDRPDLLLSGRPPFLASSSTIAPHARAPGSKLRDEKAIKAEEKVEIKEKFAYDIWGDHIFALPWSKEVSGVQPNVTENNSDSFFVIGPQALMTIAQSKSVSFSDQMG